MGMGDMVLGWSGEKAEWRNRTRSNSNAFVGLSTKEELLLPLL
jgi:hypothetical protein